MRAQFFVARNSNRVIFRRYKVQDEPAMQLRDGVTSLELIEAVGGGFIRWADGQKIWYHRRPIVCHRQAYIKARCGYIPGGAANFYHGCCSHATSGLRSSTSCAKKSHTRVNVIFQD